MIKVLQFSVSSGKGGRTQYILNNWNAIDRTRFQFDFITFNSHLDFEEHLCGEGCRVYHMSCYPEEDREQFVRELDAILENGYDAIHIHTSFWKSTIVEERARLKNTGKIIIHAHGSWVGERDKKSLKYTTEDERKRMEKEHVAVRNTLVPAIADEYLACSMKAAEWIFGDRISKERIRFIPNAIDAEKFRYDCKTRKQIREEYGITDSFIVGNVGRFVFQKNHEFLIDVFYEFVKYVPEAVLMLVGEGALKERIYAKAREYKIEGNILFLGGRNDVNRVMQAMDVFALPSVHEGLPIVLVEAQAAGLPCMVSDTVTREAALSKEIEYLPLVRDTWVKKLLEKREKAFDVRNLEQRYVGNESVRQKGYNIKEKIKVLESIYQN